jgi:hypothetical protein
LDERAFDLASFYARVRASAKERNALRQDLVRALKDYFDAVYGYDRYGAETIFVLSRYLGQPYIFGFAALRILHDRRISTPTKIAAAELALEVTEYGADGGLPFGLFGVLHFLAQHGSLPVDTLRYGLVVSAGEYEPFRGLEKAEIVAFFRWMLTNEQMPATERAFWGHSLVARHRDQPGASDLIGALLGSESLAESDRRELCQAWTNSRQPRLTVDVPENDTGLWEGFVAEHMPFWVAHAPSWPTTKMIHLGLVWLARLGGDPLELARTYITYHGSFEDQVHSAVADIIAEHHQAMPEAQVRGLIEQGIAITGSSPTRRRFYRLGTDLFGSEYLTRASSDAASSVRQWAVRQLQKQE